LGLENSECKEYSLYYMKTMCGDLPSCKIVIGSIQHVLYAIMHS